jgi:hypothetical protein
MNQVIVLGGAAALLGVLAKRGQRNRFGDVHNFYKDRTLFKQFELAASNLKNAAKNVDSSALAVEVALKAMIAA